MDALRESVNAGIGAPGRFDDDLRFRETGERFLEYLLHRESVPLALPAAIASTEVLKREEGAHLKGEE